LDVITYEYWNDVGSFDYVIGRKLDIKRDHAILKILKITKSLYLII